jgi:hypothetical protein
MNVRDFEDLLNQTSVPYGKTTNIRVLRKCGTKVYITVVTIRLPKSKGFIIYKIFTGDKIKNMSSEEVSLFITTYKLNCLFRI